MLKKCIVDILNREMTISYALETGIFY